MLNGITILIFLFNNSLKLIHIHIINEIQTSSNNFAASMMIYYQYSRSG